MESNTKWFATHLNNSIHSDCIDLLTSGGERGVVPTMGQLREGGSEDKFYRVERCEWVNGIFLLLFEP